ncbi:hypothetical protein BGZ98_005877, partial [Dissophora globulifera]
MQDAPEDTPDQLPIDQPALQELELLVGNIHYKNPMDIHFLINHPAEQVIGGPFDEDGDTARQEEENAEQIDESSRDSSDDDEFPEAPLISAKEAYNMMASVETFILQQRGSVEKEVELAQRLLEYLDLRRASAM